MGLAAGLVELVNFPPLFQSVLSSFLQLLLLPTIEEEDFMADQMLD
jgi:hypothetical protein